MTYIIAGVPRSGKTSLKNKLLNDHKISGISTDLLREGLRIGMPELGLLKSQDNSEGARILWPAIKGILSAREYFDDDFVIEGTNILPEHIVKFNNDSNFKICFLGYTKIEPIDKLKQLRTSSSLKGEWTDELDDEKLLKNIIKWIDTSKLYFQQCEKLGIRYFDSSIDMDISIQQAEGFLLS